MSSSDNDFDDDDDDFLLALSTNKSQSLRVNLTTPQAPSTASTGRSITNNAPNNALAPAVGSATPAPAGSSIGIDKNIQAQLYRADGEIAILREKYQNLQNIRQQELTKLKDSQLSLQRQNEEQIKALQNAVEKLEDEKKFLNNELKGTSHKRRKVRELEEVDAHGIKKYSNSTPTSSSASSSEYFAKSTPSGIHIGTFPPTLAASAPKTGQKLIRIPNDSSLFIEHIWNYCINGAQRTSLSILSKIYAESNIVINSLKIERKNSISNSIVSFLMAKKNLRLDDLVTEFSLTLVKLVEILIKEKFIVSVPFLLSMIYAAIVFRPAAVVKETIHTLLRSICNVSIDFLFILEEAQNQEDYINVYHDVPDQVLILEKFTLLCSVDIVEKLATISTLHGHAFIEELWTPSLSNNYRDDIISPELIKRCLPENTERYKNTSQINLVYNMVEILMSSITEESFAFYKIDSSRLNSIFNSLLKVLLIDIPLKDDFMFFGLNRILGNNIDMKKVESVVPVKETPIGLAMISVPCPIPFDLVSERVQKEDIFEEGGQGVVNKLSYELHSHHQTHLLALRIRVATLLDHFIVTTSNIASLQLKDHIKSIVRTIGYEQSNILKSPRSKNVHFRTQIIAIMVRILHYISSENKGGISSLVYPETIYEIFVTLSRIAFGSNSLSKDAHEILVGIRNNDKNFNLTIFNRWCEIRAKQLNHIDQMDQNSSAGKEDGRFIADIESQYANGLEFPYEEETIELAREILDLCVTHEEADNLFFNMNFEDPHSEEETNFDEMDLVQ